MLIQADQSVLLMIDLQERLAPAIHDFAEVRRHNQWLLGVAQRLAVPVVATEQYPRGLGHTIPELAPAIPPEHILEKIHFSAVAEGNLDGLAAMARPQVILTGIETHVCVLQTALDLLAAGKAVHVVAEAVGSRRPADKELALARLRQEGCRVVSREMVAFEWLHRAGTEQFKAISQEFLR
ncbi:hydrolase [Parasulfuritortus cantonensis]|uniref:Hydrolase n=1 Tax=Parasulfuritortus cantonensis TaxID=2528202 RepID=A0A4R1BI67_9PROT|nr:hydrolase [Parasulfuritortus cantonensis]TCJ16995.1 hydrolase [Parasulfuritortus cantonensis]TCJ20190.1 hydrolase [Parasulfuritortus cantonensis]